MTVCQDLQNRIDEARAEGTVSGRLMAILCEQARDKLTEDQLDSEIEERDFEQSFAEDVELFKRDGA